MVIANFVNTTWQFCEVFAIIILKKRTKNFTIMSSQLDDNKSFEKTWLFLCVFLKSF